MSALILPAASLVSVALLLGWLAHASSDTDVGRNSLIGIRTRATMASDEAWAAGHQAAAGVVLAGAWTSAAAGLLGGALAVAGSRVAIGVVIAGYLAMLALLLVATARANRAARRAHDAYR